MNTTDALHQGLIKMLNYLPMIYNQRPIDDIMWKGEYIIRYPYKSIPENALLFMLPTNNSIDNSRTPNINKLTIQYATVSQDGKTISYQTSSTYNILIEEQDGSKRYATEGDIIANKLCVFRFITNNTTDIILCNNPRYDNLQCSSLHVTNNTVFKRLPEYIHQEEINGVSTTVRSHLADQSEVDRLNADLELLKNKFQIGTESPEKFFEENKYLPNNTIYFQMEE